jgi:hypothetical protein
MMEDQSEIERDEDVTPEPETETAEQAKPEWTEEDAAEARAFGWKPADKWVGEKPADFVDDPRVFLSRSRTFKVLREKTERLEQELAERLRKMEAITAKTIERERAQHQAALDEIKRQQLEAVDSADRERYDALERQKASMVPPPEMPVERPAPTTAREVEEYAKQNDWVNNPILRQAGAQLIDAAGMAGRPIAEQLAYAEREVRKLYPGAFQAAAPAPQKPMPQRVDSGGLGGAFKVSGFDSLPPEAKAQFKRDVASGLYTDDATGRKEWSNAYNSI